MFYFTDLRETLAQYLSEEQVELISQAYLIAHEAHKGQKRYTGEDYITHPVEVARILAGMQLDYESIMVALLHDVVEDTSIKMDFIRDKFGDKVAELVDGVTKLTQIKFDSREEAQAENFRKMMLAMAQDIRVIIIKLADRLHNMRTLTTLPYEKRRRIALETLEIYAPIANRLGMNNFKVEFEDLGFAILYPLRYRVLKEAVRKTRGNRKALVSKVEQAIREGLTENGLKNFAVWGREKHLYSLYKKMRKKRLPFSEVLDFYGFRIIVENRDNCYQALGIIHGLYRPVAGRFKDYIAIQKVNAYQSLHTTLIGPTGIPIEVQIRTQDMDQVAENGIAAHWRYKHSDDDLDHESHLRTRAWLKDLMDIQNNTGSSLEFIESVKIDLYPDAVYVFTPKGSILSLPQGATPIDFAYLVHTDIGNSCVACKIDRRLAPLSSRLESGQTVEIITAPGAKPNPGWLSFTVTGKASSNIRHWLKNQQRNESEALGKRLVNAVLAGAQQTLDDIPEQAINNLLAELKIDSLSSLFVEVGLGKRQAPIVAQYLLDAHSKNAKIELSTTAKPLVIKGTEGLVVTYATCCNPIPGDLIIGHLVTGQGIIIHTEQCPQVAYFRKQPLQCIHAQWEKDVEGEFQVPINVDVINDRGVLGRLASTISESNVNIINVDVDKRDGRLNTIRFLITVRDRAHLARIMRRLRALDNVTRITRGKGV